ncbi:Amidohydrolase family protein [Amycolatopsis arida]|uniref:Amidohydrolase family protein n=1 Tax=Amycolatopsis arida TaxID=587909 RepID=A0A1I5XMV4_9PSEU|nr:amidohydrolase family protein [Amycolatopsis arida]TDX97353.1 amidohydrolase family protein [Amycolatopsis arida]SFQ33301.1 Amidohydrolase family protein [Amycolatopsis arida]
MAVDSPTDRRAFLTWLARCGAGLTVAGGTLTTGLDAAAEPGGAEITILTGATVIDGTGRPGRPATVVLVGDRIVAVGHTPARGFPPGARVLRLPGKYLIPGLWDMHVHSVPLDRVYPPLYVVNGVTGVREMYGYFHPALHDLRERIDRGEVLGPRMVIASTIIDGPHSIHAPTGAAQVATPDEARAAVRAAAARGADFVKAYSFLGAETFAAVAAEARRQRLPVVGHVPERVSAGEASDQGLRSIEHLFGMFLATSADEDRIRVEITREPVDPERPIEWFLRARRLEGTAVAGYDPAKADALFARLRRNGTWQSPTLTVLRSLSLPVAAFDPDDERLAYLPPTIVDYWWRQLESTAPGTPEQIAERRAFFAAQRRLVGTLDRAGVGLLAGTDANNPFCFPGFGLHDELDLLVEAGLSPARALRAATLDAARFLGLAHTTGTITPGASADLVVLDADPLADIRNTRRVHAVVLRGRYLSPEERRRVLADIREAAREPLGPPPAVAGCGCWG